MPRRYCGLCRSPLPQWVRFLFGEIPCRCHAHWIWLFSMREHQSCLSVLADSFLFREWLCPLRTPVFLLKKQWGRGSQRISESELTSAQSLCALLSPHREVYPVLFSQPNQHPSTSTSDLVLFGGSDEELNDDSMSLAASDAEELSSSVADPRPPAFVGSQRRQSRIGCRTSQHPLKGGGGAVSGVVSTGRAISQPSGWLVPAGASSDPSSAILAVLPWSSRRAHFVMALKKRGTRRCLL